MRSQAENKENRKDWLVFAFGATAVLAGALALAKGASFFRGPARAEGAVAQALARHGRDPNDLEPYLAEARETAASLKEKNLFIKKPPRQHPVKQVDGILGSEALIGGKWYKAGDKVQDARIVAVEATQVRIEWDGREKAFAPLQTTDQLGSGGSPRTSRSHRPVARAASPTRRTPQTVRSERSRSGGELSAEQKERARQKAEKQRQASGKKELRRTSREEAKKSQPDRKKKSPDELRKAREKASEKKARRLAQK